MTGDMLSIFNGRMSVDSSPDLDKILYRSMYVDSSPNVDKISTCDTTFRKNGCQVMMGNLFEIEIFVLKYVLNHSESIPTKKMFDQKFLCLQFFRPGTESFEKKALSSHNGNFFF